jgi:transposase
VRDYASVVELAYGLQAQVDFGFYNMTTLGKNKKVQFLTFVLSRSRYKYILFSDIPFTTTSVINAHESAFQAIKVVRWRSFAISIGYLWSQKTWGIL